MPLVRRRHYSWPFSGPSTNAYSRDALGDTGVKQKVKHGNAFASTTVTDNIHQLGFLGDNYNDDALSAGIIPSSKNSRTPRLWRSATSNVAHSTQSGGNTRWNREAGEKSDVKISTITQANELPTAVLRRLIWPRLEKARLHVLPHHHSSSHDSTPASISDMPLSTDNKVIVTIVRSVTSTPSMADESKKENDNDTSAYNPFDDRETETAFHYIPAVDLRVPRRMHHRRCHSAQPRAWQEPSPGLWTLLEE